MEEAAIVPLYYGRTCLLLKPWVRSFPALPMADPRWKDVVIEPHGATP